MKQIVVIGGGPAGYPAALKAASLGAKVVLVEKNQVGGVCLHCGCIPSKSFLEAAHRFQTARGLAGLCSASGAPAAEELFAARDLGKIQARQQAATRKLTQGILFLLKKAGVELVQGTASFVDEHTLRVTQGQTQRTLTADGVILATGTEAAYPPPFDKLKGQIYDNTNFFSMSALPTSLAIIGGGVIGCEMADLMLALGVKVEIVEMQPRLLPPEDENAARVLTQALTKRGAVLHTGVQAVSAQKTAGGFEITLSNGTVLRPEAILAAIGRVADLTELHLENIGVAWTRKGVSVQAQTLQLKNNIYAAGDVTGLNLLAHAASRQGEVAAANLCGVAAQYHNERIPCAIYTTPEIASVGLTHEQAQAQGLAVRSYKAFFLANGRAVAQEQTEGFAQWLADEKTDRLVGALIVGKHATELIHVAAVALEAGFTVSQLRQVVFAHPTFAESLGEALHG